MKKQEIIWHANYVEGRRIDDAWRNAMWLCVKKGHDFVVKKGSYEGQVRRQLTDVSIRIIKPGERPLSPIMPPSMPPPTDEESIEKYFMEKLMDDKLGENEDYTYGQYINPQLSKVIDMLFESGGNTNQACISVGDRDSVFLGDPPCLRVISFKIVQGKLVMTVFFRSWDLIAGMPQNLGGLQLLKEYVLVHLSDLEVSDGPLIAYSDGLHIYDQYFEIADYLNVDKIKVSEDVLRDKKDFAKTLDEVE